MSCLNNILCIPRGMAMIRLSCKQQYEVTHETSLYSQKKCSRRLDQNNIFALVIRLQKTPSRRLGQDQDTRLGHTPSRHLEDVLQKRLQDFLKTFWRRFQDVLRRYLQDVFKTYHQVKVSLLTCLWDVVKIFLRPTAKTVIYRRICGGHTSEKFVVSVQNLHER